MMPVFPIKTLLLLIILVAVAGAVLGIAAGVGRNGTNVLKKQGVAWVLTIMMVLVAVGVGYAKAPFNNPAPEYPSQTAPPASRGSYVRDEADVLSDETVRELDKRNQRLWDRHQVTVGVVTCDYGRDDLYQYAAKRLEKMGLGGYDMIVVLDIRGDNYWLYTGDDVAWQFSDEDCAYYAGEYLEYWFARGMYGDAVLHLTEALESWYNDNFD